MAIVLRLDLGMYREIHDHLLPRKMLVEEAGFLFGHYSVEGNTHSFFQIGWMPVKPEEFVFQSAYYLEVSDETRASAIKRAHDLDACLIEFHSHLNSTGIAFSHSDRSGLEEFVPHVRWRLKGKPYLAFVFSKGGFDSLAWISNSTSPNGSCLIKSGDNLLAPSGISIQNWETMNHEE